MWTVYYTKQARKDAKKLNRSRLRGTAEDLIKLLEKDPYASPPHYKELSGKLAGAFSRHINIQHRLVYQVFDSEKQVKILRMWTHYE